MLAASQQFTCQLSLSHSFFFYSPHSIPLFILPFPDFNIFYSYHFICYFFLFLNFFSSQMVFVDHYIILGVVGFDKKKKNCACFLSRAGSFTAKCLLPQINILQFILFFCFFWLDLDRCFCVCGWHYNIAITVYRL